MPMLDRVEMVSPDGRLCAVMVREIKKFEKQGYRFPNDVPVAAEEPEAEPEAAEEELAATEAEAEEAPAEAPALAVESRAFEQPDRKPAVKRRRRSK